VTTERGRQNAGASAVIGACVLYVLVVSLVEDGILGVATGGIMVLTALGLIAVCWGDAVW
jgi:hypothetical protein